MLTYETIFDNMIPQGRIIVKGTQPKTLSKRTPADLTQSECYLCINTKDTAKPSYEVVPGKILQVRADGRVEVEIIYRVKNHKDYRVKQYHDLFPDEFGSTPVQAVENKL